MHELSLCRSMLRQIERIANQQRAIAVESVIVSVGPLSGVEAPLLLQAFPLVMRGSVAEKAQLHIEASPIMVRCNHCGAESQAQLNRLDCAACGDTHTTLLSGDEMLLVSIEVLRDTQTGTDELNAEVNHV